VTELLEEHALPRASFHHVIGPYEHVIGPYEVDFAFPEARVAVEVDGWGSHGDRAAFESDRARDLALASRGWLVVRLTWWAVTRQPARVFAQLRQVLDRRAAA
jgi:very-short-patch-repair endonuclease